MRCYFDSILSRDNDNSDNLRLTPLPTKLSQSNSTGVFGFVLSDSLIMIDRRSFFV